MSVKLPGPQSPLPCSSSHSDVEEDFQDALRYVCLLVWGVEDEFVHELISEKLNFGF